MIAATGAGVSAVVIVLALSLIAGVIAARPQYQRITAKERERIAPEILQRTEELLK